MNKWVEAPTQLLNEEQNAERSVATDDDPSLASRCYVAVAMTPLRTVMSLGQKN